MKTLLEKIDVLLEDSYGPSDVPSEFYLVFNFDPDRNPDTIKQLSKGVLKGVKGISGSNEIVLNFVPVGRSAIMKMDGRKVVKNNNLSRVLYDNPHYIMSKDMWALKRLLNVDGSSGDDLARKSAVESIFNEFKTRHHRDYSSPAGKSAFFLRSYEFEIFEKNPPKRPINSIDDAASYIHETINLVAEQKGEGDRVFLSERGWQSEIKKSLRMMVKRYKQEAEWIVKDEELKVPAGSVLMVSVRKFDDDVEEMYREWKRRKDSGAGPEGLTSEFIKEMGRHKYWFEKREAAEKAVEESGLEKRYRVRYIDPDKIKKLAVDLRR